MKRPRRQGNKARRVNNRTDCDVLVVGGGGSGLAAAITAAENGARVIMLEKAPYLRGSTGRSIGSIAASCTPDQQALGVQDCAAAHAEDYLKIAGVHAHREDRELVDLLTSNVTSTYNWLVGLGMEFFGPVPDPGHRVPRLHNILPTSQSYIHHLAKRARTLGVQIELDRGAAELVRSEGRVSGVIAESSTGRRTTFTARRAVVLCSGDFSAGTELKREFISDEVADYVAVNPYAHGDAQRMARSIGGRVLGGDVFDVPSLRFMPPPSEGLYGLLQKLPPIRPLTRTIKWGLATLPPSMIRALLMGFVTTYLSPDLSLFKHGALLVDTDGTLRSDTDQPIPLVCAGLGDAGGYLIGDQRLYEKFSSAPHHVATAPGVAYAYMPDFARSRKDIFHTAPTIAELAKRIGVGPETLEASVVQANDSGLSGDVRQGPFFAMGPVRSLLVQTNGGLKVNRDLAVLDGDDQPIAGLFAAGNAGQGGVLLMGYGHHLGWAFTSGRIAGRHAAQALTAAPVLEPSQR